MEMEGFAKSWESNVCSKCKEGVRHGLILRVLPLYLCFIFLYSFVEML